MHITGSDKTHDRIVWGPPGADREARKQRRDPLLKKPITSELGNISPVIVVPGPYTEQELRFQAEDAASYLTMNASFLCHRTAHKLTRDIVAMEENANWRKVPAIVLDAMRG